MKQEGIHRAVRQRYSEIAKGGSSCCNPLAEIGYSPQELAAVPEGANLGLGCGNPTALVSLRAGETVLDLGSGAGLDCFLAARQVGPQGHVLGVDMTPEMIGKARRNAARGGYENVEFRQGHIEALPVESESVDVVISNCVINLAPDKEKVFREAHRVLRPGGRMMVADLVLIDRLPERVRQSVEAYLSCVAGALEKEIYLNAIRQAGFARIEVLSESRVPRELIAAGPTRGDLAETTLQHTAAALASLQVRARK